jgi:hypothetical protein
MNERHCQQTDTLFFAPYVPSKLVAKKQKNENSDPLLSKNTISIILILLFYVGYGSLAYSLLNGLLIKDRVLSSIIIGIFPAIVSVMGITSEKFTQFLGITKPKRTAIHIFEEGIQIGDSLFEWSEIIKIQYKRKIKNKTDGSSPQVKLYLQNGNVIQEKFDSKSSEHQKSFLLALAWASQYTKIDFHTENQQEYALLVSVVNNYENMKLEKPHYLSEGRK